MNLNPLATNRLTFEEFCIVVPDGRKADLIAGVIYMASPDNLDAADVFGLLHAVMRLYVERNDLGSVHGPRVAFRINGANGPEPDVAFVSRDRRNLLRRGFVDGPPDLAIEIVSPDSVERDYVAKRHQYREAGVSEYWIIDEENQRLTLLRLDARGRYREVRPRQGKYLSRVLPGFFLRADWLWQDPLPRVMDLLNQILDDGGPGRGPV
jgi:Uma2 family endonuclease